MRGSTASFAHSFNRKHNRTLFHLYSTMPRNLLPKMPRKRSPIFLKVSLLIHKLRKPIIPKLFPFLKKLRKREELKLLRHYDYGEYQFSASSTPLIHRNQFKNRGHRDLCSLVCVLVHGKLQSRGKWRGSANWELRNWRWVHRSRGFVWFSWREGREVHWDFLPADENAESESLYLFFTFISVPHRLISFVFVFFNCSLKTSGRNEFRRKLQEKLKERPLLTLFFFPWREWWLFTWLIYNKFFELSKYINH